MGGISRRPQAAGGDVRAGLTSQGLCRQPGAVCAAGELWDRQWENPDQGALAVGWDPFLFTSLAPRGAGWSLPSTVAHRSGEQEPVGGLLPKALHKLLSCSR